MKKISTERIVKLEFYSLCLLGVSLPLIEATKNLAAILLLVFFLIHFFNDRKSLVYNPLGKYILLFIGLSVIASIGSSLNGYDSGKIKDIIRYALIGWITLQIPLKRKEIFIIILLLILSCIIAIGLAYISLHQGWEKQFELRSVGHINHTAIYIILCLGLIIPLILIKRLKAIHYGLIGVATLILLTGLFEANSRATLIAMTFIISSTLSIIIYRHRMIGVLSLAGLMMLIVALIAHPPSIIKKALKSPIVFTGKTLTPREKIWHSNIYMIKKEPLFGIGYGNHGHITADTMSQWFPEISFGNGDYFLFYSHAHNRFMNTLVEGGILGLTGLIILLGGVVYLLFHLTLKKRGPAETPLLLIASNTLFITCVIGLFNTTMHHEHGILTLLIWALVFKLLFEPSNDTSDLNYENHKH